MKFADSNDYLDIIIYVVIMVVGLIASAYRNYSKKKDMESRQPGEVMPDFPEVEFESIFDIERPERKIEIPPEISMSDLETIVEPEPVSEEISTIDSHAVLEDIVSTHDANLTDIPLTEGQAAFESTSRQLISDNIINELGVSLTELQPDNNDILKDEISDFQEATVEEGIDLEQAVIYSEILRQKYFSNSY